MEYQSDINCHKLRVKGVIVILLQCGVSWHGVSVWYQLS